MRRIALVNQKGGVGKTTTAVNLCDALSRLDRKVLLIDLDPQSNATISLGIPPTDQKNTTYAILNGDPPNPIEISPNLHLIPSSIDLAGAESELAVEIGRETILREALKNLTGYDFILLDCSPSLGLLSINALSYVTEVMVPLQCEFLALHGISLLTRTVDLIKRRLNPELEIKGVIPCMYDVRKGLARETVEEIQKYFKGKVFKTRIRTNVRLAEAPSHGLTIFEYAPDSNGAEDYMALAREVVGIEPIVRAEAPAAEAAAPAVPEDATPVPDTLDVVPAVDPLEAPPAAP
jgi:chromosome partitioning protein